jgi:hypothetical protein
MSTGRWLGARHQLSRLWIAPVLFLFLPIAANAAAIISPYGTVKWFFAEGGETIGGHPDYHDFQTYYHFANVNSVTVTVQAHFQGDAGSWDTSFTLPPYSRTSVPFHNLAGGRLGFHAAEFYSSTPGADIQVSSTMLNNGWEGYVWEASKAVNGASDVRTSWSFGEGGIYSWFPATNGPVFDHFYAVYNPNDSWITVSAQYFPDEYDHFGNLVVSNGPWWVAPHSRLTFNPYPTTDPSLRDYLRAEAGVITCSAGCVAQMTMYQLRNVGARRPNTQSALGSAPANRWYVVGIPTGASWQNRIYFFNSANANNTIHLTYRDHLGNTLLTTQHTMPPLQRISYDLSEQYAGSPPDLAIAPAGRDGSDLSLQIDADYPIVLTKIMYWAGEFAWNEGASTSGHAVGGPRIFFPGGNTGGGFYNYKQIMNTSDFPTTLTMTTFWPGGNNVSVQSLGTLPAKGMLQFDSGVQLGQSGDFATVIESNNGAQLIGEASNFFAFENGSQLWRAGDTVEGLILNWGSTVPIQP